jgi:hypothetical protein
MERTCEMGNIQRERERERAGIINEGSAPLVGALSLASLHEKKISPKGRVNVSEVHEQRRSASSWAKTGGGP